MKSTFNICFLRKERQAESGAVAYPLFARITVGRCGKPF